VPTGSDRKPLEDDLPDAQPRSSRRGVLVAVIGLVCLVAVAAGLFAVLRDDGGGTTEETAPEVTFGPEGDATSILAPLPGANPILSGSVDAAPAGSEVTVQGAGFRTGKDFGAVELYWDKVEGKPLKTVSGPRFSEKVRIPEDAPVLTEGHNIIAAQRTKGKLVSQASLRFFVVPVRR
jgi:hypothetical protein